MNVSIKLLSRILKTLKIINKKYYFQKKLGFFSNFQRTGVHVKEHCQVYMCTKFHVDILKNGRVLVFWG